MSFDLEIVTNQEFDAKQLEAFFSSRESFDTRGGLTDEGGNVLAMNTSQHKEFQTCRERFAGIALSRRPLEYRR